MLNEELLKELLTVEKLEAWLRSQPPDRVFGNHTLSRTCPVACYLQEKTGQEMWVGLNYIGVGVEGDEVDIPDAEVKHFVSLIGPNITTQQALSFLQEVTK